MKIVFLSKQRPQGRDLISRAYGRFYHIPQFLAEKGHEIYIALLGFNRELPIRRLEKKIYWVSRSIFPGGPVPYLKTVNELISVVKPEWIVGFSDTYYGILAVFMGEKFGIKSCIDAYDNFESYIPWLKPLHHYWRRAISKATMVTAAGPHLARHLNTFRPGKKVHVVPMAADPSGFKPLDKVSCRRKLHLPLNKKLVGYCGSIYRNRGIKTLFQALKELRLKDPNIELVISGRNGKGIHLPKQVKWLGYLPDDQVPILLNSLDVLIVSNRRSAFGNFSYPVKLYEAMQCRIPVVATDTPPANWILSNSHEFLARPEDPTDLVRKIELQLSRNRYIYGDLNTWEKSGSIFEKALLSGN